MDHVLFLFFTVALPYLGGGSTQQVRKTQSYLANRNAPNVAVMTGCAKDWGLRLCLVGLGHGLGLGPCACTSI